MNKGLFISIVLVLIACKREASVYWPVNSGTLSIIPNGDTLVYLSADSTAYSFYRSEFSSSTVQLDAETGLQRLTATYSSTDSNWFWYYTITSGSSINDSTRWDKVVVNFNAPTSYTQQFDFGSGKYIYSSASVMDTLSIDNRTYYNVYLTQSTTPSAFLFNASGIPAFSDEHGHWYHFEKVK